MVVSYLFAADSNVNVRRCLTCSWQNVRRTAGTARTLAVRRAASSTNARPASSTKSQMEPATVSNHECVRS